MQSARDASRKGMGKGSSLLSPPPTPPRPTGPIDPKPGKLGRRVTLLAQLNFPFFSPGWPSISPEFPSLGLAPFPHPVAGRLSSGKSPPTLLSCHSGAKHRGSLVGSNPSGRWGHPGSPGQRPGTYPVRGLLFLISKNCVPV